MPFWYTKSKEEKEAEKGRIYDTTGMGSAPKEGKPDDFYDRIQAILKEVVGGLEKTETKMNAYHLNNGEYQWLVHLVVPRKQAVAAWNEPLSHAKDEKSKKEEEMAGYLEQFKAMSGIAAHIRLLRKSGPVKEYRRAEKELEELVQNVADLESKVKELGTYGYWVQEFPSGKYAVYPYPSVLEIKGNPDHLVILLSPQLQDLELFHSLGVKIGERVQQQYKNMDVHIGFSENAVLYTQPLSEVRAKEKATDGPGHTLYQ